MRARVRGGLRDIPAEHIRRRYDRSLLNLIELLPLLTALRVYDNSSEANPSLGKTPKPKLVLDMARGTILNRRQLRQTPNWAKPIVAAAIKLKLG
jgi:predicted ABC-type ATPase